MASEVDWKNMGPAPKQGDGNRPSFMKFEAGKAQIFRPIGKAVQFYKFFIKSTNGSRSVNVDPEFKDKAKDILSSKLGEEAIPKLRFAINVINRATGNIEIMEGGRRIFDNFANWSQANNNESPGGKAGWDWSIKAEGEKLNRQYFLTPIKPAPFSAEEVAKAKEKQGLFSLSEVFKSCPMEELCTRIFGESAGPSSDAGEPASDPAGW